MVSVATFERFLVVFPAELPAGSLSHIGGAEVHHDPTGHGRSRPFCCGAGLRCQHQGYWGKLFTFYVFIELLD